MQSSYKKKKDQRLSAQITFAKAKKSNIRERLEGEPLRSTIQQLEMSKVDPQPYRMQAIPTQNLYQL